jgi:hypothetical protein
MIGGLAPYQAYKDSGVPWLGEVPEHWKILPNRALFAEVKQRERPDEQMLSVTITRGVIRQSTLLEGSSKKDSSKLDKSAYKLVCPHDIAYNKMRAWQGAIGVSELRGIVSPAYVVICPLNPCQGITQGSTPVSIARIILSVTARYTSNREFERTGSVMETSLSTGSVRRIRTLPNAGEMAARLLGRAWRAAASNCEVSHRERASVEKTLPTIFALPGPTGRGKVSPKRIYVQSDGFCDFVSGLRANAYETSAYDRAAIHGKFDASVSRQMHDGGA